MKDDDDFFDSEEQDENESNDSTSKEDLDKDFFDKLKKMSDESEVNAEGKQAFFGFDDDQEDEPFKPEFAGDIQHPEESYDLYYAIRRMLMQGLPENKSLRQMVYDEKNLYLRNGVDRPIDGSKVGADSRQSRLTFLREAYAVTQNWMLRGGSAYDIFIEYYDLNKRMKFR